MIGTVYDFETDKQNVNVSVAEIYISYIFHPRLTLSLSYLDRN